MKSITYNIIILVFIIPFLSFANGPKGKYKETKTIEKSFEVNNDALLKISNSFGNVDIATWDKNRIEIKVVITVGGNNHDKVLEKLDNIHIGIDGSNQNVSAITHTKKATSWFSSNWFNWGNNNIDYKINYTIKMPVTNDLDLSNDYGSIYLNNLEGEAKISCDFGKMIIGSLRNANNELSFDYTKNSTIAYIEGAIINADFSGVTIESAKKIKINADYTSAHFDEIDKLEFSNDFGSITVGKANYIKGSGDYVSMKFGKLFKKLDISADFGSLKIQDLQEGFESVVINTDYTGIRIGINENASCKIISNLEFGNLKHEGDNFNFIKTIKNGSDKYYEGYFGSKNTDAVIETNTEFGSVKFFEN